MDPVKELTPSPEKTLDSDSKDANDHSTTFEKAIAVWSTIGLSALQSSLDDQGTTILENQKNSLLTRKELASRTKAFRKLADDEKIGEIKALLKLYQGEIDSLTQRSKFAENSFISLYKLLAEAPDPTPLLEVSVDSVSTASEMSKVMNENVKLTEKLSKYADYEQIKAKLLRKEQEFSESIVAKVKAKEAELNASFEERESHWKERESELNSQVQEARDQIKELRSNNEVLQARLSAKSHDQLVDSITDTNVSKAAGRIAELELVARELERANKRMLDVEKRNVKLRSELENAKSGTQIKDKTDVLEGRISDLERENALLAAQLDTSRTSASQSKIALEKKNDSLAREIERKVADNTNLKKQIESMGDYYNIKRELDVLKSVEFSFGGEDESSDTKNKTSSTSDANLNDNDDLDEEGPDSAEEHASVSQSLERLMLARNKQLSNDLTEMRISKISLEEKITDFSEKLDIISRENEKLRSLNAQLEGDLAHANDTVSKIGYGGPAMSVVSGWGRSGPSVKRGGRLSPTASIIGGYENSSPGPVFNESPAIGAADSSILPIITQQRDRFRTRNTELEEELKKSWNTATQLRKDLEAVKRDNVELYEKARYASSYKRGAPMLEPGSVTESNYRNIYEEGLSPYQQFKGRENERALSKMGPVERALYLLTRTILVNRTSRYLFGLYCLALHLLVMLILMYGVSWHTSAELSSETKQMIPEALGETS